MAYLCDCTVASAAGVGAAHCYFLVINNDAGPRARYARRVKSPASMLRSGRLGQAKNAFGDGALTDTEAAFSLARNGRASHPSPGSLPAAPCGAPDHAPAHNKTQSTPDETRIVRV